MAFPLSSSHSNLSHDHQHLCKSLSPSHPLHFSQSLLPWTPKSFNHHLKFNPPPLSTQPRSSSVSSSVAPLQDPVPQISKYPHLKSQKSQYPSRETMHSTTSKSIWVNPKSTRVLELRGQSYTARYDSLAEVAKSLNSCRPTEVDVCRILSSLGGKFSDKDAVTVLNKMENPEVAMLALNFFMQRLKLYNDVILHNVTLKVFRKVRNLDRAEKFFQEMVERGARPDKRTFSTMISCARLCASPDKALEWYEKMPQFECEPDDVIRSAMIDVYGRMGNNDYNVKALDLYDQARRKKWRMDIVTYTTVMKIYSMSGNLDGAYKVYTDLRAIGLKPNLTIYNTILDVLGKAKRPWQVRAIFKDMNENGISPNYLTYAALLRAYCKSRFKDEALSVYREMKEKGFVLNAVVYNTILALCADVGTIDDAIEIFEDMKCSDTCKPDTWTYSSMITIYSCSGKVLEAEEKFNEMLKAGIKPNIYVLTSLIQCYGKANQIDDVLRTFDQVVDLGVVLDDRVCCCLLNVMNQAPKEELGKLVKCIEKVNTKLGYFVKLLVEDEASDKGFTQEASDLFDSISTDVRKAYCNCLIDLCIRLNQSESACELLDLGLMLGIYSAIQSKDSSHWSVNLKSLSHGAAITAFHIWMNDLSTALASGEKLPPILGINTGHSKHNPDSGLAGVFSLHLRELNAPFHEDPDQIGWFVANEVNVESWLKSRSLSEPVAA